MERLKIKPMDQLKLTDLIDVETLQAMQDAFSEMSRMASLTTDENGIAITKGSSFTDFCTNYCRKSPLGKIRCEQCDKMGAMKCSMEKKPVSYYCHAGLVDFAAPIMLGDRMIGSFVGGQVLTEVPDINRMKEIAKTLGVEEKGFLEALKQVQIVPREAVMRSTTFLFKFAGVISNMVNREYTTHELGRQAMEAATQKADFLANMSHEIRTPMNAVLGMAELALRYDMPDEARDYIHQIQASGKHLLTIINDILDFSKIESGKMEIIEDKYNPAALVGNLINIVNSRIGEKDIEFTVDMPYDMPRSLVGDAIRIQQIMINLLNNAVKFTQNGNINLKMRFEQGTDESTVIFHAAVSDTGIGIRSEDIDKLFKSFNQVDSKRNRNIEGTGLGLAITQQLLTLMNGHIDVDSEYKKGSTFTLEFPQIVDKYEKTEINGENIKVNVLVNNSYVKRQLMRDLNHIKARETFISRMEEIDDDANFVIVDRLLYDSEIAAKYPCVKFIVVQKFDDSDENIREDAVVLHKPVYAHTLYAAMGLAVDFSKEQTEEGEDFSFIAPDAKVLIVDDNPVNLSVAKGLIEPLKMQVDTALNAHEAISRVTDTLYDMVLMDHMMPEVDGIEVTHIIRRMIKDYNSVPIIALTANAVGGAKEMFLKEGMDDFLAKPIELKKILAMIRKWLPENKIIRVEASEEEEKPAMEINIEGLDIKNALKMLGSENMLITVIKEYCKAFDKKYAAISEHLAKEDWKSYTIEVHALKSTSKQIGANSLSAKAAELEKAGNELNTVKILNETAPMLEEYKELALRLKEQFGEEEKQEALQADPKEIKKVLDALFEALDSFDTLQIDEVLEQLGRFSLDDTCIKRLGVMKAAVEDMDLDACTDAAREWAESLG